MKLNLGSGSLKLKDYENIDISDGRNAYPLDYIEDGSCEEIRASHILEYFGFEETKHVLSDWCSKLMDGGVLKIAVPDFRTIAKNYLECKQEETQKFIMGGHKDANDFHKAIFDNGSLTSLLESVGLTDIKTWNDYQDTCSLPVSLNLQGTKKVNIQEVPVKIQAIMSMPRLAFTDNLFTAHKSFLPLGIDIVKGTGAFWEQVLSNQIEQYLDNDYIITLDYDSFFVREHVIKLCQLMQEHPEADAIVPVQAMRENDRILFGGKDDATKGLVPIDTGHFGLTIFRCSALRKMTRPWIWGQPNSEGRWGQNRIDPDIYFWNKFKNEGFNAYLSKEVFIGHLQLMCSWVGRDGKPIHSYMNDVNCGESIPEHCIPKVDLNENKT